MAKEDKNAALRRMLTGEDEETRRIRQNVILMQVPVINPDGYEIWSKAMLPTLRAMLAK